MSSANVYVTFNPLIPTNIAIAPPNLNISSEDVEIVFIFRDSPGMVFKGFHSNDKQHQLKTHVTDTRIIITDLDNLPEHIKYTLSLADAQGQPFVTDPQIINNPKVPPRGVDNFS